MNDRLARIILISSEYEEFKDLHSAKKIFEKSLAYNLKKLFSC